MKRSARLLAFATCLAGGGLYLYFATAHGTAAVTLLAVAGWLAMQAIFPRIR